MKKKWGVTYQLVPPDMHRRNAAERAIRTFKAYFLTILVGVSLVTPPANFGISSYPKQRLHSTYCGSQV